ncbi:MAG TPA: HcpA family protein, partial [Bradyrhizobium sp.]|nr:HcpA family protein [Bradyrhizobium sp.]
MKPSRPLFVFACCLISAASAVAQVPLAPPAAQSPPATNKPSTPPKAKAPTAAKKPAATPKPAAPLPDDPNVDLVFAAY